MGEEGRERVRLELTTERAFEKQERRTNRWVVTRIHSGLMIVDKVDGVFLCEVEGEREIREWMS